MVDGEGVSSERCLKWGVWTERSEVHVPRMSEQIFPVAFGPYALNVRTNISHKDRNLG